MDSSEKLTVELIRQIVKQSFCSACVIISSGEMAKVKVRSEESEEG